MGLRDLFRLKKKKKIVRRDEKRNNTLNTVSSDNKEAPTPYAYNSALFEKF